MSLPGSVREEVEHAVRRLEGDEASIRVVVPVGGGCINHGTRLETGSGGSYFLKWNPSAPRGIFEAEADGLRALRAAAERVTEPVRPRVPRPLATSEAASSSSRPGWLLMEWLSPGPSTSEGGERLGRGLASLHALSADMSPEGTMASEVFGWERSNWIGSLPQSNTPSASWADFWRDQRIAPQLATARDDGYLSDGLMDDLMDAIPRALAGVGQASLVHGDLWSGNSYPTDDGRAALVDPAVYRGDGEVDLAMTELFGGFGDPFYTAYDEVRPISAEYPSHRRALYQLYYLLVHVNLFGASYLAGSRRAAETVLAELG